MEKLFERIQSELKANPRKWLLTGAAGFIGSNILTELLQLNQTVVGLDNLSTGRESNFKRVENKVGANFKNFTFINGDIGDIETCKKACSGAEFVLHQAALGSVVRSVTDPLSTHKANVDGFLNILMAARDEQVKSFVYASSSSVYGDNADLPKVEANVGSPLSPYAVSKKVNELYANVFASLYNLNAIGLRYFNVFGVGQDPESAYAAVIPRWVNDLISGRACSIFGDGTTSRDFCYISNVVEANIRAAYLTPGLELTSRVFNIGAGGTTSLLQLFEYIAEKVARIKKVKVIDQAVFAPPRIGDIRHSLANVSLAKEAFGYTPKMNVADGLEEMISNF